MIMIAFPLILFLTFYERIGEMSWDFLRTAPFEFKLFAFFQCLKKKEFGPNFQPFGFFLCISLSSLALWFLLFQYGSMTKKMI